MADKLSEGTWSSFTKKQKLDLDDDALLKALTRLDKTRDDEREPRLEALKDVADQLKKQVVALARRKKELGDKPFGLAKDKLGELLDLAEAQQKEAQAAVAAAAAAADEEADTPALLTTKMVPLLRELRKGEARMHALICTAGKNTTVLIMRRAISPSRRKLLADAVDAKGGAKYFPADCLYEEKVLTFVMKTLVAGMAKRLRQALLDQTEFRLKVKVRGEDGVVEEDGEDAGDEQAGAKPAAPKSPSERQAEAAAARSAEQALAASAGVSPASKAADVMPKSTGAYARMKAKLSVQLDSAKARNAALAGKITAGITAADALSAGNDDAAAVARLRTLVAEVENTLAADREDVEARLEALVDKATRIRLRLNPEPHEVEATVRGLVKQWNLAAAQLALTAFEKAIDKARPIDFEDIDVIQKRRAEQHRKENAKFARNTEQALMAAQRVVDDQGNLVLDGGPLKGLPFIRTDDLAAVAAELAASGDASLPQSVHALQMLQRLQKDKGAQAALQRVSAPPDPATAANEDDRKSLQAAQALIRNSLGLAANAEITDVEARRAAMAALLAQVRQVDVGSCFGTASAVRVQRNNPAQFLADMAAMFSTGKLTRVIESPPGTPQTIVVPISRDMVDRKVEVARKNSKLDLPPNMIAGLDALGVEEPDHRKAIEAAARRLRAERAVAKALGKIAVFLPASHTVEALTNRVLNDMVAHPAQTIEAALDAALTGVTLSATGSATQTASRKKLATDCATDFDNADGVDAFTPQQLIEQIGRTRPSGALPPERIAAAKAAYDTSQDNTLTRAWEYTLASMAEQHPRLVDVPKKMAGGIGSAAKEVFAALAKEIADRGVGGLAEDEQRDLANDVAAELDARLQQEVKVRYDPQVQSRSGAAAADGNSTKGGWCLFFRGTKIEGQAEFEAMAKTLLDEVEQKFDQNEANRTEAFVRCAKALARHLKNKVETKDFRDSVVESMAKQAAGKDASDEKLDAAKNDFSQPWTCQGAGWELAVMQLCDNKPTLPSLVLAKRYTYKDGDADKPVTDAEGLTHFLLDSLSKLADRLPDGDAGQGANVPVANTAHAFALMPGSTSLATVLKLGKKPADVVKELKAVEGAKNEKRRAAEVPIKDVSKGLVRQMMSDAVFALPAAVRRSAAIGIRDDVKALGADTSTVGALHALIKRRVRAVLDTEDPTLDEAQREAMAAKAAGSSAANVLAGVLPKEEYEPLIDAAMRKLSVPDDARAAVKKAVLGAMTQDAALRQDFAKAVGGAMRDLELGGDVEALDEKLEAALVEPRGLVFADSNWGDGDHMTHFSMVVNPLSDPPALEMWQMNEDGSSPTPMGADWIEGSNWRVYADPDKYNGVTGGHEVTTASGRTMQWEAYRAELQAKFNDCVSARKGDAAKMRRILDVADARFAEADYAAADTALAKLAGELAPVEQMASVIAKGIRALEGVAGTVAREVEERRKKAHEQKLKTPTPQMKEAFSAHEVLGALMRELRGGVDTPQQLAKFVSDHKDVLDYIDTQNPLGAANVVGSLTL